MVKLDLSSEVAKILDEYKDEVFDAVEEEGEKVGKKAARTLKSTSPKDRGRYAQGWRNKKIKGGMGTFESVVHNATHPGLTHLTEKGHATRSGGRTAAQPHIRPVEEMVKEEYEQNLKARLS